MLTKLFISQENLSEQEFLAICGTAESGSEHPLGQAVVTHAKEVCSIAFNVWISSIAWFCVPVPYVLSSHGSYYVCHSNEQHGLPHWLISNVT